MANRREHRPRPLRQLQQLRDHSGGSRSFLQGSRVQKHDSPRPAHNQSIKPSWRHHQARHPRTNPRLRHREEHPPRLRRDILRLRLLLRRVRERRRDPRGSRLPRFRKSPHCLQPVEGSRPPRI